MATLKDIKDEIKTIAEAHSVISTFKYGNPWQIEEYVDITYPLFHLNKIRTANIAPRRKDGWKIYNVTYQVLLQFNESDKATQGLEEVQELAENYALQILDEFDNRSLGLTTEVTTARDWHRLTDAPTDAEYLENYASQNLAGIEITTQVRVFEECVNGTFSY